jgi:hypothetical protein
MKLLHQGDFRRVFERKDGIQKIEVFDAGTGRKFNGTPAIGHWKTRGFKCPRTGKFAPTLRELKEELEA